MTRIPSAYDPRWDRWPFHALAITAAILLRLGLSYWAMVPLAALLIMVELRHRILAGIESRTPSSVESEGVSAQEAATCYQAMISVWTSAGQDIWSRINAMLVWNTVLVACIGFGVSQKIEKGAFYWPVSVLGIVSCIIWFNLFSRAWTYHHYYLFCARECEGSAFKEPSLRFLERGRALAEGGKVTVSGQDIAMDRFALLLKSRSAVLLLLALFAALYILSFLIPIFPKALFQ